MFFCICGRAGVALDILHRLAEIAKEVGWTRESRLVQLSRDQCTRLRYIDRRA